MTADNGVGAVTGGTIRAHLWWDVMTAAQADLPAKNLPERRRETAVRRRQRRSTTTSEAGAPVSTTHRNASPYAGPHALSPRVLDRDAKEGGDREPAGAHHDHQHPTTTTRRPLLPLWGGAGKPSSP